LSPLVGIRAGRKRPRAERISIVGGVFGGLGFVLYIGEFATRGSLCFPGSMSLRIAEMKKANGGSVGNPVLLDQTGGGGFFSVNKVAALLEKGAEGIGEGFFVGEKT